MNATQTQAQALWAASTSQQSLDRTSSLLQSVQQYTRSEQTCVAFLQSRIRRNEDEVQALAAELQRETPTEAKLARVVQLRHAIASDREALNALLTFAAGIERKLAEMLDGATAEAQKEVLVPIYVAFFEMGVPKTISMEVYNALVDAVNAALPKPEPKKSEVAEEKEEEKENEEDRKDKELENEEETKEQGKTKGKTKGKGKKGDQKKQTGTATGTGRKWGVVKQQPVKSVDVIQKEIQASRQ